MADDSEEDTLLLAYVWQRRKNKRNKQRRFWIHDIIKRRMALGEYPRLLNELRLDAVRFKQYFRMTPTVFDELLCLVEPCIFRLHHGRLQYTVSFACITVGRLQYTVFYIFRLHHGRSATVHCFFSKYFIIDLPTGSAADLFDALLLSLDLPMEEI